MDRRAVVVAVAVLAAGCSAVPFGTEERPAGPTETVTAAPVPATATPDETASPDALPPGVAADGYVDAGALSAAHADYLTNRSYTWFVRYDTGRAGFDGGVIVRRAVIGNETFFVEQVSPGPGTNTSVYVNATGGFVRSVTGTETEYDLLQIPGEPTDYVFAGDAIRRFLGGSQFSVTPVDRDGRAYYRLYTVDGPVPVTLAESSVAIQNYTATAYVTPEGFVRSLTVTYDRSIDGNTTGVTFRYDYSRVGDTVPLAPDWVGEVPQRSTPTPSAITTATPEESEGTDTRTRSRTATTTATGANRTASGR